MIRKNKLGLIITFFIFGIGGSAFADDEMGYKINAGDILNISVWKEPDLQGETIVRPDGGISFPLVGDLNIQGKTVENVRQLITGKLQKYIPDPVVTVAMRQIAGNKLYVIGKVNKPGEFLVGRPANVMQALAMAGGLNPFASPSRIVILRRIGDKEQTLPFDYKAVSRGEFLNQNITLLPGDVVVVP